MKWCKVFEDKGLGLDFYIISMIKSLFSMSSLRKVFKGKEFNFDF